jgi:hypothetical protein
VVLSPISSSEVQHELYSKAIFSLHGDDLRGPSRFLRNLNPDAFTSIRSLRLHWCMYLPVYLPGMPTIGNRKQLDPASEEHRWEGICQILSKCLNLSSLHIIIFDQDFSPPDDRLLPPLQAMALKDFTVQLPWSWDCRNSARLTFRKTYPENCYRSEEVKFQILRTSGGDMVLRYPTTKQKVHGEPWWRRCCCRAFGIATVVVAFTPEVGRAVKRKLTR